VADSQGAVRHFQPGYADIREGADIEIVDAAYHVDFLFERHAAENRFDALVRARRRLICEQNDCAANREKQYGERRDNSSRRTSSQQTRRIYSRR
jgi:hypothetical protein